MNIKPSSCVRRHPEIWGQGERAGMVSNYPNPHNSDRPKNNEIVEVSSEELGVVKFQYTLVLPYVGRAIGPTRSLSGPSKSWEIGSLDQLPR